MQFKEADILKLFEMVHSQKYRRVGADNIVLGKHGIFNLTVYRVSDTIVRVEFKQISDFAKATSDKLKRRKEQWQKIRSKERKQRAVTQNGIAHPSRIS